jgi:anaerobic selenocysteine-containing dehydrogenase
LAGLARGPEAALNPHDLDRLGVGTGDRLRLSTPRLTTVVPVVVDAGVPRGCVALAFNVAPDGPAEMIDATTPVVDVKVETI